MEKPGYKIRISDLVPLFGFDNYQNRNLELWRKNDEKVWRRHDALFLYHFIFIPVAGTVTLLGLEGYLW